MPRSPSLRFELTSRRQTLPWDTTSGPTVALSLVSLSVLLELSLASSRFRKAFADCRTRGVCVDAQPSRRIDAHYWLTRSLSTGISLPFELAYTTLTASDLARDIIKAFIRRASFFDSVLLPTILFLVAASILCSQLNLLCGLVWQWGGPKGLVPVGLERRRPTHSERASRRADAQLDWRLRVLASLFNQSLRRGADDAVNSSELRSPFSSTTDLRFRTS